MAPLRSLVSSHSFSRLLSFLLLAPTAPAPHHTLTRLTAFTRCLHHLLPRLYYYSYHYRYYSTSDEPNLSMDRPPPFQRPPDRPMNYHAQNTQAYPGYPPTSQPQQQPHASYAPDPYSMPRRDPFYPSTPQHARHNSQGLPQGGNNAPQAQAEGHEQRAWPNTGMDNILPVSSARNAGARVKMTAAWRHGSIFETFPKSFKRRSSAPGYG